MMTRADVGTRPSVGRTLWLCAWAALTRGTVALLAGALLAVLIAAPLVLALRMFDPPGSMLTTVRAFQGETIRRQWVALADVSPHVVNAVVMSEDSRFCSHAGIDLVELETAYDKAEARGEEVVRGASTITMQVAKNLFLWPGRSYLRKGLEMPLALALDAVLTKRRVLELYLNIAEWGPGVFGIEAAARHHFGKSAARLSRREAAQLAAVLPNPLTRNAARPGPGTRRIADIVERRMEAAASYTRCVRE